MGRLKAVLVACEREPRPCILHLVVAPCRRVVRPAARTVHRPAVRHEYALPRADLAEVEHRVELRYPGLQHARRRQLLDAFPPLVKLVLPVAFPVFFVDAPYRETQRPRRRLARLQRPIPCGECLRPHLVSTCASKGVVHKVLCEPDSAFPVARVRHVDRVYGLRMVDRRENVSHNPQRLAG